MNKNDKPVSMKKREVPWRRGAVYRTR